MTDVRELTTLYMDHVRCSLLYLVNGRFVVRLALIHTVVSSCRSYYYAVNFEALPDYDHYNDRTFNTTVRRLEGFGVGSILGGGGNFLYVFGIRFLSIMKLCMYHHVFVLSFIRQSTKLR